jgi:hypothetical protein
MHIYDIFVKFWIPAMHTDGVQYAIYVVISCVFFPPDDGLMLS